MQLVIATVTLVSPSAARADIEETTLIGAALRTRPAYDGSTSRVRDEIPVLRYFGTPVFLRTSQDMLEGGVRSRIAPGLHGGFQLGYEPGRETSESRLLQLHHVPDVGHGTSVGPFLEWDGNAGPVPFDVLTRLRQDTRLNHGAQADLRINAGIFRGGGLEAAAFAQTTWLSNRSATQLYGIGQQEAATIGLPAFQAGSGCSVASAGIFASARLARHWGLVGTAERHWLRGHDTQSPLVEGTGGNTASLGIAYRY